MNSPTNKDPQDIPEVDNINLRELFDVALKSKKLVILTTFLVSISSILYAISLTNYYESESILSVRNSSESQGLLSQLTGAASLIGVNVTSSSDNRSQQVIQLIQSRKFVKHLLSFDNILTSLMAPGSYNLTTKELVLDPEIYDLSSNQWKGDPKDDGSTEPSYLDVYAEYMDNVLSISQDAASGFILINVRHISPVFAKDFLSLVIQEANNILRSKDLDESTEALNYLKSQLAETSVLDLRESINALIESQLEIQMLANINEDYILIEIEPPFIPEKSVSNDKRLIVIFSTIIGAMLGVLLAIVREFVNRRKLDQISKE